MQSDWETFHRVKVCAASARVCSLLLFSWCPSGFDPTFLHTLPSQSCHRYWVHECKAFAPSPWALWWEDLSMPPSSPSHRLHCIFHCAKNCKVEMTKGTSGKTQHPKTCLFIYTQFRVNSWTVLSYPIIISSDPRSPRCTEALLIFLKSRSTQ